MVVDDNSPDGTGDIADRMAAEDAAITVVHRTEKAGLGAAYLNGFAVALEAGYDVIGEMDADGSHQPEQLHRLLDALRTADLVIGSRYVPGGSVVNWPLQRLALSRGGNLYVRLLLGIKVKDATAGFRLFRRADARGDRPWVGAVYWIRVPDRPRLPHGDPRPRGHRGADRVHRARARRLQDERSGGERVAQADHPLGPVRAACAAPMRAGAGREPPRPRSAPRRTPARRRAWLRPALVVAFVVVPLVEIWAILQVGQLVGPWWTIALLVLDCMLGAWLIKREGGRAWQALREALQGGRMPAREIADGALILIGGTLMLSPGFVLDLVGHPADPAVHAPGRAPAAHHGGRATAGRRPLRFGAGFGPFGGGRSDPEMADAPEPGPRARSSGATWSTETGSIRPQPVGASLS